MSHTEAQQRGPAYCLCQQEPHRCRDKVCQHRERTSSHRLCLPIFQHLSTGKELCSRERPQTTGDDCHEEPCECVTTSSEDAAGVTEIQCHHKVQTREPNATGQCPQPLPSKSLTGNQIGHASRLHCLHEAIDRETEGQHTERGTQKGWPDQ